MTDNRYRFGIWLTALYLLALLIYTIVQRDAVLAMTPNEVGDSLAGAASPLAFLWLVLGYLQQGEELKQNTQALNLQVKELQASVDQQRAMVEATQRHHEFELERDKTQRRTAFLAKQPILLTALSYVNRDEDEQEWRLELTNVGHRCTNVTVRSDEAWTDEESLSVLDQGEGHWWRFCSLGEVSPIHLFILYSDGNAESQMQEVVVNARFTETGSMIDMFCDPPRQVFPWESAPNTSPVTG